MDATKLFARAGVKCPLVQISVVVAAIQTDYISCMRNVT